MDETNKILPDKVLGFAEVVRLLSVEGMLMEFGVYTGHSFLELCDLVFPRVLYGFDWFRGLPKPWEDAYTGVDYPPGQERLIDLGGEIQFRPPKNGRLVVGLVEETLPGFLRRHTDAVAFAHLDMDLYEPTVFTLKRLTPRFRTGTILVFDEIDGAPKHINNEQRAFREWVGDSGFDWEILGRRHHGESWVVRLI